MKVAYRSRRPRAVAASARAEAAGAIDVGEAGVLPVGEGRD
jgi:hypothetical protein